ncbi:hypothetical protein [Pedobacter kyonggii]|uniref:Lipoprotein n=1 Tax=Pedobacter kyonggii TaxID=1926871 RepID=A0A4Q9HAP8_9SPHI|nr:hypothetical protein [Pedobacter kyonggii]TBO41162.1 hypothetical protein EYS08_15485 [Pedobacter kyonggii]
MKFKYALIISSLVLATSCSDTKQKTFPSLAILQETLKLKPALKTPYFKKLGYEFKKGDSINLTYKHIGQNDTSSYRIADLSTSNACLYTTTNRNELESIVKEAKSKGFVQEVKDKGVTGYRNDSQILFVTDTVKQGKEILNLSLIQLSIKKP